MQNVMAADERIPIVMNFVANVANVTGERRHRLNSVRVPKMGAEYLFSRYWLPTVPRLTAQFGAGQLVDFLEKKRL